MEFFRDNEPSVSRMEIVDTGGRRRFSDAAKIAIVAESYLGVKQVSATARRHGITRYQLYDWRKAFKAGQLRAGEEVGGFVPAVVVAETVPCVATAICPPVQSAPPLLTAGRMEVVSTNGRRVIVDWNGEVDALLQIVRGLETL